MSVAVVTGSGGLVGAESSKMLTERGLSVVGIDNDTRGRLFGPEASTAWQISVNQKMPRYRHVATDIRDIEAINKVFFQYGKCIDLVVHCAAQPSHDWAVREPLTDFTINANGTLTLLEATRKHAPEAVFIFVSTNKVYGDRPNHFPLVELATRYELSPSEPSAAEGFPENLSIDSCMHSLFGASKVAADILVQEYGRYFGMKTACFRGGCLTGPGHSGTQLHGFLAYLMRCAIVEAPYTIFGYKGKQVRDNIHVRDLVEAFWAFFQHPVSGEVFNIGGGRHSNCSMMEAIEIAERLTGKPMHYRYTDDNRIGDHIWWISDTRKFRKMYPEWKQRYDMPALMADIHEGLQTRLSIERAEDA
jgi:CDP-paratose 2-epimerase